MKGPQIYSIPAFLLLNSSMYIANLPKKVGVKSEFEKPQTNVSSQPSKIPCSPQAP